MRNRNLAAALFCVLFALLLSSCGDTESVEGTAIANSPAPDNRKVAIVTRTDGGATVSTGYLVYVRGNAANALPDEVLRMDKGDPPSVNWIGSEKLVIRVTCGQIYKFSNFSTVAARDAAGVDRVRIALEDGGPCER